MLVRSKIYKDKSTWQIRTCMINWIEYRSKTPSPETRTKTEVESSYNPKNFFLNFLFFLFLLNSPSVSFSIISLSPFFCFLLPSWSVCGLSSLCVCFLCYIRSSRLWGSGIEVWERRGLWGYWVVLGFFFFFF